MLFKFVVVENLLMLAKGAIEAPLSKVSHFSKNALNSVNRRNLTPQPITLYGGPNAPCGIYTAEIMIGNQTLKVILDTGSSDAVIKGKGCVESPVGAICDPQTNPIRHGNTGECVQLNYGNYTGMTGHIIYEANPAYSKCAHYSIYRVDLKIAGVQACGQYIGYIFQHTVGLLGKTGCGVDGFLGLADTKESYMYFDSVGLSIPLMSTLSTQNSFANSFAMCFEPNGVGGKMILGAGNFANMQFTPLILNATHTYTVSMSSISINGNNLPNTAGWRALVDTGCSDLVVPQQLIDEIALVLCPVLKTIRQPCPLDQQQKPYVPSSITILPFQLAMLPNITIGLSGATLVVSPTSYFRHVRPTHYKRYIIYQYGIITTGYYEGPSERTAVFIGDVALVGHWVYFDKPNGRIGFSSVENCN